VAGSTSHDSRRAVGSSASVVRYEDGGSERLSGARATQRNSRRDPSVAAKHPLSAEMGPTESART